MNLDERDKFLKDTFGLENQAGLKIPTPIGAQPARQKADINKSQQRQEPQRYQPKPTMPSHNYQRQNFDNNKSYEQQNRPSQHISRDDESLHSINQKSDNNHVPRLRKTFGLNPREPLQDFFTYVDNKIGQYATDAEINEAVAEVMKGEASTHY